MFIFLRIINDENNIKNGPVNKRRYQNLWQGITFLIIAFLLTRTSNFSPVLPSTPLLHVSPKNEALANNSAVTFLYSLVKKQTSLTEKKYFSSQQLDSLFSISRQYLHKDSFSKKNVVIFILESFSGDLLKNGNSRKAKTPFLDSLMKESIVCVNGYANGLESNKGIVGLMATIPPVLDEPYFYSTYNNNAVRGIGTLLKEHGYNTNFFMGAGDDHFGFGKLCHIIGIDNYYSGNNDNNPEHFDGNWGIYDHYFLPYAADIMNKKKTPFLSVLFNLSSHDPFKIPADLQQQMTIPYQDKQQNSITYVDYAIRIFFEKAKKSDWYKNTIFVFCADHYFDMHHKVFSPPLLYKAFQIPMFFHLPFSGLREEIKHPVQQMDVIPTIMDLLRYNRPFMSFGRSIYDTAAGKVFNRIYDNYQYLDSNTLIGFNPTMDKFMYYYNYKSDTAIKHDLFKSDTFHISPVVQLKMNALKAFTQRFNNSLIHNKLLVK